MNLIPIDETVSTDSEIYSIVSWADYTSGEEEPNKDYKILNEFTKNEYTNLSFNLLSTFFNQSFQLFLQNFRIHLHHRKIKMGIPN